MQENKVPMNNLNQMSSLHEYTRTESQMNEHDMSFDEQQ